MSERVLYQSKFQRQTNPQQGQIKHVYCCLYEAQHVWLQFTHPEFYKRIYIINIKVNI